MDSVVDWSRAQFALTACYHWMFVPLTLGLGIVVALLETIYYRTRKQEWLDICKFWMMLFGINFAQKSRGFTHQNSGCAELLQNKAGKHQIFFLL